MIIIKGILGKSDIFLDNIGHSFGTSGWIFFSQKLTFPLYNTAPILVVQSISEKICYQRLHMGFCFMSLWML